VTKTDLLHRHTSKLKIQTWRPMESVTSVVNWREI